MITNRLFGTAAASIGLTVLCACTTLGVDPTPKTLAVRPLDYLNDDLGSLVFALDLPTTVMPQVSGSGATFDVTIAANGARHLQTALVLADGDAVDGVLPPPRSGRSYYFLGFGDKDKSSLREAQKWAKGLQGAAAPVFALNLAPELCATAPSDPDKVTVAVLLALPNGPPLAPLVPSEPLAALLAGAGATPLPPCAGHSG